MDAVLTGHHDVEQYQVGMLAPGHFNTCRTVVSRTNLEFLIRQKNLQQQHVADHIIHNKYLVLTPIDF